MFAASLIIIAVIISAVTSRQEIAQRDAPRVMHAPAHETPTAAAPQPRGGTAHSSQSARVTHHFAAAVAAVDEQLILLVMQSNDSNNSDECYNVNK